MMVAILIPSYKASIPKSIKADASELLCSLWQLKIANLVTAFGLKSFNFPIHSLTPRENRLREREKRDGRDRKRESEIESINA